MSQKKRGYPSDVSDEEWEFCLPYLTLMREDAPQREHSLRELFNALRWMIRAGCPWRMIPTNFPPWKAVYDQSQRWIRAGVFEAMAILRRAYAKQHAIYEADQKAAGELLKVGAAPASNLPIVDHAALTAVCLALFNLDEALTRE